MGYLKEKIVLTLTEAWAKVPKLGLYFLKSTNLKEYKLFYVFYKQKIRNIKS